MASDRFSNQKYINWVIASLSLQYTKEGIETFTDRQTDIFHNKVKSKIPSSSSSSTSPTCYICSKTDLQRQWNKKHFVCPNNVCNYWLAELQNNQAFPGTKIALDNVNVSELPNTPWECAKLYLPFGNLNAKGANDTDIAALMSLYLDCRHFHPLLGNLRLCEEVIFVEYTF